MPVASSLSRSELRPVVREFELAVQGDDPVALLARLFFAASDLEVGRLAALGLDVDALVQAGVLTLSDDGRMAQARVIVDRVDGAYLLGDRRDEDDEYVASVSGSTRLSAAFLPRVQVERAADIGTGSGALALLAARRAASVVATDINPRALEYTRKNAELNEIGNVETRAGSFYEPVAGERFGLVAVNPPYVMVPDGTSLYRDSGSGTDSLSRELLGALPSLLDEGGWGVLQGNWAHGADEPWHAPIGAGLAGSGCDAFLVRTSTESPLSYASRWSEFQFIDDPDGYRERVRELRRAYIDAGIDRISGAVVMLRRRSDAPSGNWRRALTIAELPVGLGERLPKLAAAQDRLETIEDLREERLVAPPGLRVERVETPGGDPRCVLVLPSALSTRRPVPPEVAAFVLGLDGKTAVGDGPVDQLEVLVKTGYLDFA
jgi:SAM-dependent methyltransferase